MVWFMRVKNNTSQFYYGGSAAQSPLLPFLDISSELSHENSRSQGFLLAMREYMLKPHREFLEYQGSVANIREFIASVLSESGDSSALNGNTENKTNNTLAYSPPYASLTIVASTR